MVIFSAGKFQSKFSKEVSKVKATEQIILNST